MGSDFGIAVQVTIVGMVLVFLTLIICALVISALNRVFKPQPEGEGEERPVAHLLPVGMTGGPGEGDEAAAVAVAIALARRAANQPQRLGASPRSESGASLRMAPGMSRLPQGSVGEEIVVGEVVTVTSIDPGPATWSGYGRVKAAQ